MVKIMKKIWRVIVLIILTAGVIFYLRQQPENYSSLANKIDIQINKVIISFGITDENIIKNFRIQKRTQTAKWIQFVKEINTDKKIADIITEIKISLSEFDVEVNFDKTFSENLLTVSKNGNILNKILFLQVLPLKYKAAIIIDDVGYKNDELENFLALPIPLTFSILPFEKYSVYLDDKLKKQNCEFLLHQPMEPEGYPKVNPGKAAILLSMSDDEIEKKVKKNLANVDSAIGINNHMGSAFTRDKTKMEAFLKIVKEKNLIFVDSLTSPKSVAYKTAKAMGIPTLQNEIFLDNEDNLEYILKQLSLFKKKIKRVGSCIAIGHIHKKNLPAALAKMIPEFEKDEITFLTVSEYLKR
ncbi:MAG: divergent polysaccharide deacetylase family protein [Elusimicrobiota bacterium]|nr:divergent polysaccharide deacetylase family protein [Elusimicrobiota bacterium]